ncbi:MAG: Sua5/YciO/YrdC/YwlC family protein [Methanoregula sp.]|nr:Sua5/YciO/YrdC/YwlC family protein [Methanoregula sp.]
MDIIERAAAVLMHDGIVVYPTETVYGLGADALSEIAILRVYEAKKRPLGQPVSIAVSDFDMLGAVAYVDGPAQEFIQAFLPGPVTVVLEAVPRDLLIDGGRLPGTPSTVVDLVNRTILRRGIQADQIERVLGSL